MSSRPRLRALQRFAPGVQTFTSYRRSDLRSDLVAGLSVASIALPVGIAYADLVGVPTMVGIFSAIFPLFAYALFGSSRQLIVGPDTATCLIVAASLGPLAAGDPQRYVALLSLMTLFMGVLLICGGIARLGFLANFLSQPILTGYLNGVAILILLSQFPKLLGLSVEGDGVVDQLISIWQALPDAEMATMLTALPIVAFLLMMKRFAPLFPAPLIAVIGGLVAVQLFNLDEAGLDTLGKLSLQAPVPVFPLVDLKTLGAVAFDAAGIGLVAFTSGVLTSKSFARKNGYRVNANQEFIGFGASNLASWLVQGFPVTGAGSRTAVSDAMRGKTQMVGIIAALTMLGGVFLLARPLASVPLVALAAVVCVAAVSLLDLKALKRLYNMSRREFFFSITTTLGVLLLDVLSGVLFAVALSLVWLLAVMSRPKATPLGRVPDMKGFHSLADFPHAKTTPGLLIFRFDGNLIFFNAEYFRRELFQAIDAAPDPVEWVIIDASPINVLDATALQVFIEIHEELRARGIQLASARVKRVLRNFFTSQYGKEHLDKYQGRRFETIRAAIKAFERRHEKSGGKERDGAAPGKNGEPLMDADGRSPEGEPDQGSNGD